MFLLKELFLWRGMGVFQEKFGSKAFNEMQGRAEKTRCPENDIPVPLEVKVEHNNLV